MTTSTKSLNRILLTHVGISLLDCDAMTTAGNANFKDWRDRLKLDDVPTGEHRGKLILEWGDALTKNLAALWASKDDETRKRKKAPAEIASLSLLKKDQLNDSITRSNDRIVLLHSDTPSAKLCAELLKSALMASEMSTNIGYPHCEETQIAEVKELRVNEGVQVDAEAQSDANLFVRKGLPNYVTQVWKAYQQLLEDGGGELIFNITSGYKGMIPIARDLSTLLTSYASDRGHNITSELCYLYMNSKELIHIPALPLKFDWSRIPAEALAIANDSQGIAVEHIPGKDTVEYSAYFVVDHDTKRTYRSVLGEIVWVMVKYVNDTLRLDGTQVMEFRNALAIAFPGISNLKQMVRHGLNENLDRIVNVPNNLDGVCFELIEWAQARGRTRDLLNSARKENSGNPLLQRFAQQFDE